MTIEELEAELPHGLHDALLRTFSSDPDAGRAELVLDVWVGDLRSDLVAERERRRPALLELIGLGYLVIEDPDPRFSITKGVPVQIDACRPDDDPELARRVPAGGFAGRFFITESNAFIHFSALDARLTWLGVN